MSNGVRWTLTGAIGGAILGLTLGGPVGFVAGAVAGAVGGKLRDETGKSALEHYEALPPERRAQFGNFGAPAAAASGGEALTRAELEAIPASRAPSDTVACKICMESQIAVRLAPCGHACMCGACFLRLTDRGEPLCPVCRARVAGSQRVFI